MNLNENGEVISTDQTTKNYELSSGKTTDKDLRKYRELEGNDCNIACGVDNVKFSNNMEIIINSAEAFAR